MADPVLLFRYSALTFNGHRIHYDRDYVTKVEGYPGLIFHGPMQAAFLVEFATKLHRGAAPKKFSYRGVQPLFEGSEFYVNANDPGGKHGLLRRFAPRNDGLCISNYPLKAPTIVPHIHKKHRRICKRQGRDAQPVAGVQNPKG